MGRSVVHRGRAKYSQGGKAGEEARGLCGRGKLAVIEEVIWDVRGGGEEWRLGRDRLNWTKRKSVDSFSQRRGYVETSENLVHGLVRGGTGIRRQRGGGSRTAFSNFKKKEIQGGYSVGRFVERGMGI